MMTIIFASFTVGLAWISETFPPREGIYIPVSDHQK